MAVPVDRPSSVPDYVSHVSDDGRYESIGTHLAEVSEMATRLAAPLGLGAWAKVTGAYHDIGKYSKEFQRRILEQGPKVDHSGAGSYELAKAGLWPLAYCVAGHHGGLPDGGVAGDIETTLVGRLNKVARGLIPDYSAFPKSRLPQLSPEALGPSPIVPDEGIEDDGKREESFSFSVSFLIRMLFSCLVDADYLCTERFMRGAGRIPPPEATVRELSERLEARLAGFYPPVGTLNERRCAVLDDCLGAASHDPGVYSLTVPTGGGKTFASMRFALQHARRQGMDRVIVAEPYTSIIEQNAQVYREVFGAECVLEHHSNVDFDVQGEGELLDNPLRLAAENWDRPIVVTTNVQLFESLFASGTSACRKLHNIAHSVIVLDEAQMIPTHFLIPCIRALAELVRNYGCTVVLCTATQPALSKFFGELGLAVHEIVSGRAELFSALRRVSYRGLGSLGDDELVRCMSSYEQALCIVNSRRQARGVFEKLLALGDDDGVFHLTTSMYPRHREFVLKEIRTRLEGDLPCKVIATSLIEAGVDVDFPVVFRSVAGLDSIVQAAGRCNREGRHSAEESTVYVFSPGKKSKGDKGYAIPAEVSQRARVAISAVPLLSEEGRLGNLDSLENILRYFDRLYFYKGGDALDEKGVVKALSLLSSARASDGIRISCSIPFRGVSARFRLIDDRSATVVIPDEEVACEIDALVGGFATRYDLRKLGRYSVGVYETDLKAMLSSGMLQPVTENLYLLLDLSCYSMQTGLDTTTWQGEGTFW